MRREQKGIALILVLWMVALLSVIAGNFASAVRTETIATRNHYESVQARTLADAGVYRAIYELANLPNDVSAWRADGIPHHIKLAGGALVVTIVDESAKIDLNVAQDALLRGLFRTSGLMEEEAEGVLDAILDWRDTDSLRRLHGAEEDEYRAAGRKYRPANAPFETIEELQRVLGVTPNLYRKISGSLTVNSMQAGINAAIAPREVLLALPGVDPGQVDAYLALRNANPQGTVPFQAAAAFAAGVIGVYCVSSEARLEDGTVFVREAIFRLPSDTKRPITFLSWREGAPLTDKTEQGKDRANAG